MRKLWVKAWITLDGVFDADTMDHWWHSSDSAERRQYIMEEYSKGDAYLLGRVTYEMLWPGWSTQTTGDGPGPILNRMHKYVVSTTLTTAPWKVHRRLGQVAMRRRARGVRGVRRWPLRADGADHHRANVGTLLTLI